MELMIEHKVVILKNNFCSLKQKNHPVLVLYLQQAHKAHSSAYGHFRINK